MVSSGNAIGAGGNRIGALAAAGQIAGLTWDNVRHASGETHFAPARR